LAVRNLAIAAVVCLPLLARGVVGWKDTFVPKRSVKKSLPPLGFRAGAAALVVGACATGSTAVSAAHLADSSTNPTSSAYNVGVLNALCSGPQTRLLQPYGSAGWLLYMMRQRESAGCPQDPVFIW